jgi:hypothetical protein
MWMRAARADLEPERIKATQIAATGHRLPRYHRMFFSTKTRTGSAKARSGRLERACGAPQGSRRAAATAPAKRGSLPGRAFAAPTLHA